LFYQLQSPLFRPREGGVDGSFAQIQFSTVDQIFGQHLQDQLEATILLPFLKTPMTGLIRRITIRQILPGCSRPQNPQHPIQHRSRIPWWSPFPIRTSWFHKGPFQNLPLGIGQIHLFVRARNRPELFLLLARYSSHNQQFSSQPIYETGSSQK
jgi:hypothetical protein